MRTRTSIIVAVLLALFLGGGSVLLVSGPGSGADPDASASSDRTSDDADRDTDAARAAAADSLEGDGDGTADDGDSSADGADPSDGTGSADPADEEVAIPEDSPFRVEGVVVAADGRELPSALVQVHPHRVDDVPGGAFEQLIEGLGRGGSGAGATVASGRADRFGEFSIALPGPGEFRLSAELPPLARGLEGPFRITEREPRVDLLVVLGGGLSIEGVVVGTNGRGVGGATVSLLDRLEGELPGRHFHALESRTRSDGTFRFDGLEPRRYILTATANGSARTLIPSVTPPVEAITVTLDGGSELTVRVVEGAAGAVRTFPDGVVLPGGIGTTPTAPDGAPIAGARVYALNPVGFAVAETDANGFATLFIGGENASLRVTAPGYREGRATRVEIPTAIDPETGTARPRTIALAPIEEVSGQVVHADGTPAANAELLEVGFGLLTSGLTSFSADAEGRFTYSGAGSLLARGGDDVGPLPGRGAVLSGSGGTITLRPTSTVTGRLVGPGGWPVAGAEVRLALRDFAGGDSLLLWSGATTAALTGMDGAFALAGVPAWGNRLELVIYADGSPDLHLPVSSGGGSTDLGEIVLGEEAILTGIVRTPEGGAPSAAAVILELDGAPPLRRDPGSGVLRGGERVIVAGDGTFAVGRLPPTGGAPLVLHVVAPPYLEERRTVTLEPGENGPLDIVLRPGGGAAVRVEDPNGNPRAAVEVTLDGDGVGARVAYTGADGVARFSGLTPATYDVSVAATAPGGSTVIGVEESIGVVAGSVSELVVEVPE